MLLSVNNDILTKSVGLAQSNTNSKQYQAMDWLVNMDGLQLMHSLPQSLSSDTILAIIDRYVLAVIAYSFGGANSRLHTDYLWLSDNPTCSWLVDGTNQLCNGHDEVANIYLSMSMHIPCFRLDVMLMLAVDVIQHVLTEFAILAVPC